MKSIVTVLTGVLLFGFAFGSKFAGTVSAADTDDVILYVSGSGSNSSNGQSQGTAKATIAGAGGALSACPSVGCSIYQLSPTREFSSIIITLANVDIYFAPGVTTIYGNIEMLNNNINLIGYGDDVDQESTTGTILNMTGALSGTQGAVVAAQGSTSPTRAIMRPKVEGIFFKGSGSEGGLSSDYSSCVKFIGSWHGVMDKNHCLGSHAGESAAFTLEDINVSPQEQVGSYYNEISHNVCRYMAKCIDLHSVGPEGVNQNHITFNNGQTDLQGIAYEGTSLQWNTSEGNDISSGESRWVGFYMTGGSVYNLSIDDALEQATGRPTIGLYLDRDVAGNIFIHPHFDGIGVSVEDHSATRDTVFIGNPASTQGPNTVTTQSLVLSGGVAYSTLAVFMPADGTERYCTDCRNVPDGAIAGAACVGGGRGSIAKRLSGQWLCN